VSPTDGSTSCFDIANHPGEVLVITDYSWIATALSGTTCATAIIDSRNVNNFYFSSSALAYAAGIAAKTEHFTTGTTLTGNPLILRGKHQHQPCELRTRSTCAIHGLLDTKLIMRQLAPEWEEAPPEAVSLSTGRALLCSGHAARFLPAQVVIRRPGAISVRLEADPSRRPQCFATV